MRIPQNFMQFLRPKYALFCLTVYLLNTPLLYAQALAQTSPTDSAHTYNIQKIEKKIGTARDQLEILSQFNPLEDLNFHNIYEIIGNTAYDHQAEIADAIFDSLSDFSFNLGRDVTVGPRRRVYNNNNGTYTIMDQLRITGTHPHQLNPWLSIGNNEGMTVTKVRQVQNPREPLPQFLIEKQEPTDADRKSIAKSAKDALEGVMHIIGKAFSAIEKGADWTADFFVDSDFEKIRYQNILSEFRIPYYIPYSAEELLRDDKYLTNDIISYNFFGGVFVNVGTTSFFDTAKLGAWATAFIQGNWVITVKKEKNHKAIIKLQRSVTAGDSVTPAGIRFKIPVIRGFLFGSDLNVSYSPFFKTLESSDYKSLEKVYRFDLNSEDGQKAYNAAIHGNFTVSDKLQGHGVDDLMIRHSAGAVKHSSTNLNLIVLDFKKNADNVVEYAVMTNRPKSDSAETEYSFKGSDRLQTSFNFQLFGFSNRYSKNASLNSVDLLHDDGKTTKSLLINSGISLINNNSNPESWSAMVRLIEGIFGQNFLPTEVVNRDIHGTQKIFINVQFNEKAAQNLIQNNQEQLWREMGKAFLGDEEVWRDEHTRYEWQAKYGEKYKFYNPWIGGPQVPGKLYIYRAHELARQFEKLKHETDAKKRLLMLNKMHSQNEYSGLLLKLMIAMSGDENVSYVVSVEGQGLANSYRITHNKEINLNPKGVINPMAIIDNPSMRPKKIQLLELFRYKNNLGKVYLAVETNFQLSIKDKIAFDIRKFRAFIKDRLLVNVKPEHTVIASVAEQATKSKFRYVVEVPTEYLKGGDRFTFEIFLADENSYPISETQELMLRWNSKPN